MNDPKLILPREAGGYGLTAQWSDDWHHAVHVALTGETVGLLRGLRGARGAAQGLDRRVLPRRVATPPSAAATTASRSHRSLPTWRLVTFAQDHDQIGNRAAGDRLSQSLAVRAPGGGGGPHPDGTRSRPCSSRARSGEPPPRGRSSPRTPSPGSARRRRRAASRSSHAWAGTAPSSRIRRTRRRSSDRSCAGMNGMPRDHARLLRALSRARASAPSSIPSSPTRHSRTSTRGVSEGADAAHRSFRLRRGTLEVLVNLADGPETFDGVSHVLLATDAATALSGDSLVLPPDSAAVVEPSPA